MPAITRPSRRDLFHPDRFARLHRVVELLAGSPRPADGFLDPDHFLLLSWCRPDRPVGIEIYRHVHTRGYLNLDADGTAYRYGAPRPDDPDRVGTYTRHRSLREAIDELALWQLPWLVADLAPLTDGRPWEERFELHNRLNGVGLSEAS
ncbi:MAG: hypothetical protein ACXVJ7_03930 [Acidimicrobiia bacterium]